MEIIDSQINYEDIINNLSEDMRLILEEELFLGNEISSITKGGFSNSSDNHIFISLKYPFKARIKENKKKIKYREINDIHYWKSEYTDEVSKQTIACNFYHELYFK